MSDTPPKPRPITWVWSAALGLTLLAVYLANGREIGTDDSEPTTLSLYTILRGDGLQVDRFYRPVFELTGRSPPNYIAVVRGRYLSRYPPGPALLAAPVAWLRLAARDRLEPEWDQWVRDEYDEAKNLGKFSAAVIVALTGVALDRLLRRLGLGHVSPFAVLAAGLASGLWPIASQALWQHGPAAFLLTLLVWLLLPEGPSRRRLAGAGVVAGMLVACRAIDVVFAAAAFGYIARHRPRGLVWFLPPFLAIGAVLVTYNVSTFGAIAGGQSRLEALHPGLHGVAGPWSGDVVAGALGTLFSPSRGLFVFSPWVALALALLPAYWRALRVWRVLPWMVAALGVDLLVLSRYAVWWAGHSFGPRYWTDAIPLFAILLAFALDWCRRRCRPLLLAFAGAILWGVAVQAVGAFLYPSDWNSSPADVDTHHERLWDWWDCELTRCLFQSPLWRGR